jgi:hypothetical protein
LFEPLAGDARADEHQRNELFAGELSEIVGAQLAVEPMSCPELLPVVLRLVSESASHSARGLTRSRPQSNPGLTALRLESPNSGDDTAASALENGRPTQPDVWVTATREGRTMEASELDVLGPVDYLVVEFPADKANFSGEMATELKSLVDRELVRVLDLVILRKNADGSVEAAELADVDESNVGELLALEADLALLLAEEDVEEIGKALEPGTIAAVLVYENSWAAPFASSIRRSGGQLVANGRIPTQALLAAIEADAETEMEGA